MSGIKIVVQRDCQDSRKGLSGIEIVQERDCQRVRLSKRDIPTSDIDVEFYRNISSISILLLATPPLRSFSHSLPDGRADG